MPKRKRGAGRPVDINDALSGRLRDLSAHDLIELIRETNPTGLDLPPGETARRYAQKSRLQSLLIRRFGGDIDVLRTEGEPLVVSLVYRPLGAHACHVPLEALDDDARSWAQRALDLAEVSPNGSSADGHASFTTRGSPSLSRRPPEDSEAWPESAAALLRLGREAMDAYDYETAREKLSDALELSPDEPSVAIALLTLLVDHMAADEDAVAIARGLPARTLSNVELRTLVALGAARSGDRATAVSLVKDHRGARSTEVFVALAHGALAASDLDALTRDLAEIRERDPAEPALVTLMDALAKCRALGRAPLEAELARLLDDGCVGEAERRAHELLRRFPDSEAGRRALRVVEERRQSDHARELSLAAEEAVARGAIDKALSLLRQALSARLGEEARARIRERIEALEAESRGQAARAAEDKVAALLGEDDLVPGLVAYLALEAASRQAVREKVRLSLLAWLDELSQAALLTGSRARAAARSVLALSRAESVVLSNPAAALTLIAAYDKTLHDLGAARDVTMTAQRLLEKARREAEEQRFTAVRAAFDEGALDRATAMFADLDIDRLSLADRMTAKELGARLEEHREITQLVKTFEELRAGGALQCARDTVGELIARTVASERERWKVIRDEVQGSIREAFRLRVDRTPTPLSTLHDLEPLMALCVVHPILPGAVVPFAQSRGVWVFIWMVDVKAQMVRARVILRTPVAINVIRAEVVDESLVILGKIGAVLELSIADFDILSYYEAADSSPRGADLFSSLEGDCVSADLPKELVTETIVVPGTSFVWMEVFAGARTYFLRIVDFARRRVVRELHEFHGAMYIRPFSLLGTPLLGVSDDSDHSLVFYDPAGTRRDDLGRHTGPFDRALVSVAPGDRRILVFGGGDQVPDPDRDERMPVDVRYLDQSGSLSAPHAVEVPTDELRLIPDPKTSLLFGVVIRDDFQFELFAYRIEGDPARLSLVYRAPLPSRFFLCQSPLERTEDGCPGILVLAEHEGGLETVELGHEPPTFRCTEPFGAIDYGHTSGRWSHGCYRPAEARAARVKNMRAILTRESKGAWYRRLTIARDAGDVDQVIDLLFAMGSLGEPNGPTLPGWVFTQFPDHPDARLSRSTSLAILWRWRDAKELLSTIDIGRLHPGNAQHVCHLLSLAHLFLGEVNEARRVVERGLGIEGGWCNLEDVQALVTPLDECPAKPWTIHQLALRKHVSGIEAADACLSLHDHAEAKRALQGNDPCEVQSQARLAEAYLQEPEGESDLFDKAFTLAGVAAAHATLRSDLRRDLPVPRGRWGTQKLNAVVERASRWLDSTLGKAWPRSAPKF